MTQEQLEQLVRILNALYTIPTRGKETVLMGQCLELMEKTCTQQRMRNGEISYLNPILLIQELRYWKI